MRCVEPIVTDFRRNLINVCFLSHWLENSISSLLTENVHILIGFYQQFIFKLNMVNVNM